MSEYASTKLAFDPNELDRFLINIRSMVLAILYLMLVRYMSRLEHGTNNPLMYRSEAFDRFTMKQDNHPWLPNKPYTLGQICFGNI